MHPIPRPYSLPPSPTTGKCDYFVSPSGKDDATGTELDAAFLTLNCACSPECNKELQTDEVICLTVGTYDVTDTIYVKGQSMREKSLKIMALGPDGSVVLDGNGQVPIFNSLQTSVQFVGIHFTNGKGTSGGAVYGERGMVFENCSWVLVVVDMLA